MAHTNLTSIEFEKIQGLEFSSITSRIFRPVMRKRARVFILSDPAYSISSDLPQQESSEPPGKVSGIPFHSSSAAAHALFPFRNALSSLPPLPTG